MLAALTAAALASGAALAGERAPKGGEVKPAVLYHNYCSVCHGDKGDGNSRAKNSLVPPPRDFTTATHLTKEYVRRITAEGKPGTAMVGWKTQLNDKEIDALAEYVMSTFVTKTAKAPEVGDIKDISGTRAHGGRETTPGPDSKVDMSLPLPNGLKADLAWGEKFYNDNCATCHGVKGDGQGPRAYFIMPKPRNFLEPAARATMNRPAIYAAVSWGRNGTEMPAWKHVLSEKEMASVSEYVFRRFIQAAEPAKASKAPGK
jgi:mono/diheme cytochrome c family protein